MYKINTLKRTRRNQDWCVQSHTSCSISLQLCILPEKSGSLEYSVAATLCSNTLCIAPLYQ